MTRDAQPPSRLVLARGARAAERRLLDEIEAALPPGEVAAPPVVVAVPSASLRTHLLGRLAARRPAWLGLEVVTLTGLVASILDRTGGAPPSGEALEATLASRLAAREPALARSLGGLVDGYASIRGAVRDLLDAGFVDEHLEAVEERLEEERHTTGPGTVDRARAIARVAAGVVRELAALGLTPSSGRVAEATRRLADDPVVALPCRAIFVHGIADAIGLHADLLAAALRHRPGAAIVDLPLDLDGSEADWAFGSRLRERWAGVAASEEEPNRAPEPDLSVHRAADPAREARAAVAWIGRGDRAREDTAVVARDLEELSLWLREVDRQGVAATSESGPPGPAGRRAAALLELLARGDETPVSLLLAAAGEALAERAGSPVSDLRLAFAQLGARTLGDAVAWRSRRAPVLLPVADRIAPGSSGEAGPRRRSVPGPAVAAAAELLAELRSTAGEAASTRPAGDLSAGLRRLLGRIVPEAEREALEEPLAAFAGPAVEAVRLTPEEWLDAVATAWRSAGALPSGRGGGAALLSVTEARGRTFSRLAVTGLARDRFPRAVRPDPLLPDALRLRLRELLPDLPVKSEGHDEERFLFAQLLGASDRVAFFLPVADAEGRACPPSPLVDELLRAHAIEAGPAALPGAPSALDAAVASALAGEVADLTAHLPAAIDEAHDRFGDAPTVAPARLADARRRLLAARSADPLRPDAAHLGPFLGLTGEVAGLDPAPRAPSVTRLERLARCGWQLFLEHGLGLAPLPELAETLPALPRTVVGRVVHEVLEGLWPGERGRRLEDALADPPRAVPWPEAAALEEVTRAAARKELEEAAIDPRLFEAALVREALARLELARVADWPAGSRELLAVEIDGEARLVAAGRERRLGFRADRLERDGEALILTDYKTGRPLVTVLTPAKRAEHLGAKIAAGEALQLPTYLLGLPAGAAARARYLFLDPRVEDERLRELELSGDDVDRDAVAATLDALYGAWDAGAFAPRLLTAKLDTFPGCSTCDVREACLQGDSSARLRFERWATAPATADREEERPARDWFELAGTARPSGSGGGT